MNHINVPLPMEFEHDFVLRPRFTLEYNCSPQAILEAFQKAKGTSEDVRVLVVDDRIFLSIAPKDQHYWSPQLEVEILHSEDNLTTLKCRFGPKPAVWTLFMFLHFIVAGLFISFAIWTYTNFSLNVAFALPLFLTLLMLLSWFVLYAGGRMGRHAGKDQMHQLYRYFKDTMPV
ncbi:MAG: GTP-binding protein [Gilvibacter sp.]